MKCHNCGFETDSKYCPMCGAPAMINNANNGNTASVDTVSQKTTLQSVHQQMNTNTQVNYQQSVKPQVNTNPQVNYQQSFEPTPNMQPNTSDANMNQTAQNFPSFESAANPQSAYFQNTNAQTGKKSKAKVLSIVISSFLAVVILSGVIINIVSASSNKSITKTLAGMSEETESNLVEFYTDMYGLPKQVGETKVMDSSSVKIKSVSIKDSIESFSPVDRKDYLCLSLVVEITNNTNEIQSFEDVLDVRAADDMEVHFNELYKSNVIINYDDFDNSQAYQYYNIESNQTKIIEYQFSVSKYAESVMVLYSFWGSESENSDNCMFEIDVPTQSKTK